MLTMAEICDRYKVSRQAVASWVATGLLQAIDCSSAGSKRRRFRASLEALERFEAARASGGRRAAVQHDAPPEYVH